MDLEVLHDRFRKQIFLDVHVRTFSNATLTEFLQILGEVGFVSVAGHLKPPRLPCSLVVEEGALQLGGVPQGTSLEAVGGLEDQHHALDGTANVASLSVLFRTLNKLLKIRTRIKYAWK